MKIILIVLGLIIVIPIAALTIATINAPTDRERYGCDDPKVLFKLPSVCNRHKAAL